MKGIVKVGKGRDGNEGQSEGRKGKEGMEREGKGGERN